MAEVLHLLRRGRDRALAHGVELLADDLRVVHALVGERLVRGGHLGDDGVGLRLRRVLVVLGPLGDLLLLHLAELALELVADGVDGRVEVIGFFLGTDDAVLGVHGDLGLLQGTAGGFLIGAPARGASHVHFADVVLIEVRDGFVNLLLGVLADGVGDLEVPALDDDLGGRGSLDAECDAVSSRSFASGVSVGAADLDAGRSTRRETNRVRLGLASLVERELGTGSRARGARAGRRHGGGYGRHRDGRHSRDL